MYRNRGYKWKRYVRQISICSRKTKRTHRKHGRFNRRFSQTTYFRGGRSVEQMFGSVEESGRNRFRQRKLPPKRTKIEEFACYICGKTIRRKDNFKRHQREHQKCYSCNFCDKSFTRKYNLKQHEVLAHAEKHTRLPNTSIACNSPTSAIARSSEVHSSTTECLQASSQEGGHIVEKHRYSDDSSLNGNANIRNIHPNDDDELDLLFFLVMFVQMSKIKVTLFKESSGTCVFKLKCRRRTGKEINNFLGLILEVRTTFHYHLKDLMNVI